MTADEAQRRSADAGEYVLGTLDAAERAAFERALEGDAALQAEVYAWQDRLLGLASRVAPVEPPATLWASIAARLPPTATARAPAPAAAATRAANDPLWQRLRRWQIGGALAFAASVLLSALLLLRTAPGGDATAARYLAVLQAPDDKSTGWVVEVTGDKVRLVPVGTSAPVPAGKSLQFWTKPEGAAGPTSLGLVRAGVTTELPIARLPAVQAQTLFELTLEPEAGSPLPRPTGPILYVGRSVRL